MSRAVYAGATLVLVALLAGIALSFPQGGEATFPGQLNGKIVYNYYFSGAQHIASSNPDGGDYNDLTTGPVADSYPSWSKDGTRIVFVRYVDAYRIWTMDADGDNQEQVPGADVTGYEPNFSPNGNIIYFLKENNLVKVGTGGGTVTPITTTGDVYTVSISPDGLTAVYSDATEELYTVSTNGGTAHPLGIQGNRPSFSPDGERIVYSHSKMIITADSNGSHATPLGHEGYDPVFSPDGQYITWANTDVGATSVQGDAPQHIWVMDVDGDNAHAVASSPHQQEYGPDWQPLGGTWTPTPSPTHSPSPTPSPTHSPSPTNSPTATPTHSPTVTPSQSPTGKLGDADCDDDVDLDDVLADLSDYAGVDPGAPCHENADTDCNHDVDARDALRIAAYLAGVPMTPASGCGQVGT